MDNPKNGTRIQMPPSQIISSLLPHSFCDPNYTFFLIFEYECETHFLSPVDGQENLTIPLCSIYIIFFVSKDPFQWQRGPLNCAPSVSLFVKYISTFLQKENDLL